MIRRKGSEGDCDSESKCCEGYKSDDEGDEKQTRTNKGNKRAKSKAVRRNVKAKNKKGAIYTMRLWKGRKEEGRKLGQRKRDEGERQRSNGDMSTKGKFRVSQRAKLEFDLSSFARNGFDLSPKLNNNKRCVASLEPLEDSLPSRGTREDRVLEDDAPPSRWDPWP